MASSTPIVTIAIPTLNRIHYLRDTLASAFAQTYPSVQVLVSENACEDGTTSYLEGISDPRLRILHQPARLSMYDHWNALVQAAVGDYFLLLSDDDILHPQAIGEMVKAFERHALAGFVFCRGMVIDHNGQPIIPGKSVKSPLTAEEMVLGFFQSRLDLWPCALLFRLADVRTGYSQEFPLGADAALWMSIVCRYGEARFVDSTLVRYRVHRNTTMTTAVERWQEENRKLATFAIEQLEAYGRGNPHLFRQITKAAERLNVRISAGLLRNSSHESRVRILFRLLRQSRQVGGVYRRLVLTKSIIELSVPPQWRKHLVTLSRLFKGQAAFFGRSE